MAKNKFTLEERVTMLEHEVAILKAVTNSPGYVGNPYLNRALMSQVHKSVHSYLSVYYRDREEE